MTLSTALIIAGVFAALAVLALIFVKNRTLRIALALAFALLAALTFAYKFLSADDEIQKAAQDRVESDIKAATDVLKATPFDGSTVSYGYEPTSEYENLTDSQKKLYDEILPKVRKIEDFTYTAAEYGYDTLDDLLIVMGAVNADHPELELYFSIAEVDDGDMTTALKSRYFMPGGGDVTTDEQKAELRRELEIFDAECEQVVAAMPEGLSTYDKYRYLAIFVSLRTTYDYDGVGGDQIATAYGAIQGGLSICQGYSRGFEYLCQKADLWCKTVIGQSRETSHAWNLVMLESGTYHIDVTWSDNWDIPADSLDWFGYFMLTQDEILFDHQIDDGTIATGTHIDPPLPSDFDSAME